MHEEKGSVVKCKHCRWVSNHKNFVVEPIPLNFRAGSPHISHQISYCGVEKKTSITHRKSQVSCTLAVPLCQGLNPRFAQMMWRGQGQRQIGSLLKGDPQHCHNRPYRSVILTSCLKFEPTSGCRWRSKPGERGQNLVEGPVVNGKA